MTKTLPGYQARNRLEQPLFITPFPSGMETANSHSSATKWEDSGTENIFILENQNFHRNDLIGRPKRKAFSSPTTKHRRSKRELDTTSKSTVDLIDCAHNTFTIKYEDEDEYEVSNNFTITYHDRKYYYNDYRLTDNGIQLCNSVNYRIQQRWRELVAREKNNTAFQNCNLSVDGFFRNNYTLFKNFTVFFKPTQQSFTRQDYGVHLGYFRICSAKLSLSCYDNLESVQYSEKYTVFKNFSLSYQMKHYDYREYRLQDYAFELCFSNDSRVQDVWKTRNSWDKAYKNYSCSDTWYTIKRFAYVVGKQFDVFFAGSAQSFKKHEYMVDHGVLVICGERLNPETPDLTKEDMLLCYDSLITIKFGLEYKVWNNFSIFHENKVYDYTEYRVVNDSINICNSTDNFVQESWKLRNKWVKANLHYYYYHCYSAELMDGFFRNNYTLFNNFTVFFQLTQQSFARRDYSVYLGYFMTCSTNLSFSCNDHLVEVNYSDEYEVFKNFSLSYRMKQYDYREYRLQDYAFELCFSNDSRVQDIWKARNSWEKEYKDYSCSDGYMHC